MTNKTIKSGIWFTFSNFLVKGMAFLTTPFFTRLLSKEQFGSFNNFTAVATIFLIITSLNLEASFIRARYDYEEELDHYVQSMILLYLQSTLLWLVLSIVLKPFFLQLTGIEERYFAALFLYLASMPAINIFQTVERFRYRYKASVMMSLALAILTSFVSVALVFLLPDRLEGRIIGYVLPVIFLALIVMISLFWRKSTVSFLKRKQHWRYAIHFSLPFIPHLLSMLLLGSVDRVMIHKMRGAEELALYSLAYTCGTLLSIFVTSINSAYSPWLGERLSKKEYGMIRKVCLPYVGFFAFIACGAVLVTPELLLILGGRNYLEARYVMPPVAAGCFMQLLYTMYVNVEQYEKKTKGMAVASVIAALVNLLLNYVFIPVYGYIAAAYTTFVGYWLLLMMHYYLVRRMGMSHVYRNKEMILLSIIVSFFLFGMTFLFPYFVLRMVIVGVMVIGGLLFLLRVKNKIIRIKRGELS